MSESSDSGCADDARQSVPGTSVDEQRDVQRLLGRCLLRIQQYERLMKAILAHHELAGPANTLDAQRSARVEKYSTQSLGTLVKALFETYVVKEGFERDLLPDDKVPPDRVSMAFSFRLSMTPERWEQTKTAVEDLVDARNALVHHFIEDFDVWSPDGCANAVRHLEECYGRIDKHFVELVNWATSTDEARVMAAQFAQTPVFIDMFVNGVAPDGSFEWPNSGIVRALRDAAQALAAGGWTQLEKAQDWIAEHHPDQTPAKYGCKSWGQVLNDSRLFQTQSRPGEGGRKSAWFRPRQ